MRNVAVLPRGAPEGPVTKPCRGRWCCGPSCMLGLGCATSLTLSPVSTSKSITGPDGIYWLHGKKVLNKENKPCATNPRATSPSRVSNDFSTLLPALGPSSVNTPSITAVSGLGWRGWDHLPVRLGGWKNPFCLFTAALLLLTCMPEQTHWGQVAVRRFAACRVSAGTKLSGATRWRVRPHVGGHLIPSTCRGG